MKMSEGVQKIQKLTTLATLDLVPGSQCSKFSFEKLIRYWGDSNRKFRVRFDCSSSQGDLLWKLSFFWKKHWKPL